MPDIDRQLVRIEASIDQPPPQRPWWQRIILPLVGVVLVAAGLLFLLTPLPLSFLAAVGFPLLCCFHPRVETWARLRMVAILEAIRRGLRSLKRWK